MSSKKVSVARRYRRWKRRMIRRNPKAASWFSIGEAGLGFLVVLLIAGGILLAVLGAKRDRAAEEAAAAVTPTPVPTATAEAAATVAATATPEPTEAPTPEPPMVDGVPEAYYYQTAAAGPSYSDPAQNGLIAARVYANGHTAHTYSRARAIEMGPSAEYTELEGVVTFRGSNYRDGGAYGVIPENPDDLTIVWSQRIGEIDDWSGVGWTGQASAVRWPAELRLQMNIADYKKQKDGLIEAFYATLDGHIYFFDMEDGQPTRSPINIGAPIKGSLSLDPRGYPLLYCGQGIYEVGGKKVKCGTRIWSLLDQSLLYMIDGDDDLALSRWRAFDSAPLVDAASDTLIQVGENGVLYTVSLNTVYTGNAISINPVVDRYVYNQSPEGQVGSENSLAVYNHYAYFANNVGIIQCVDLNTMQLVWSFHAQDDIDASLVIEVEADGRVALYGANEQDMRGHYGNSQMFKLDALTGEVLWVRNSHDIYQNNDNGGGSFATPAVGKQGLSNLVFFHVARTKDTGAMLYALDKATGATVWERSMGRYGWCSPTCVYTPSGKGYLLVGSANGMLRLIDGLTGKDVATCDLGSNIEASPVVFDDMIVIGTRGAKIFGIRIEP